MLNFDDDFTPDNKNKEVKYLEEILQNEMKKWMAREFELKDKIKALEEEIPEIEASLKALFEEKTQQLTGKENEFVKITSEFEAKISLLEKSLELSNTMLKQRDMLENNGKGVQLKEENRRLAEQVAWLTRKLEEERVSQAEVFEENLKLKRELLELQDKQKTIRKDEMVSEKNEFELKNEIAALKDEVMNIKGEYSAEKEAFAKSMIIKQQEIAGLHDVVKNYRIDLEKQSEEQQKEQSILKSESAEEIQRLKKRSEEQSREYKKDFETFKAEANEEIQRLTKKNSELADRITEIVKKAGYANDLEEELKAKEKQIQEYWKKFENFKSGSDEEIKEIKKLLEQKQNEVIEIEKQKNSFEKTALECRKITDQKTVQLEEKEKKVIEIKAVVLKKDEEILSLKKNTEEQAFKIVELSRELNENSVKGALNTEAIQIDAAEKSFKQALSQKDSELYRFKNIAETQKSIFEETLRERNGEIVLLGKKIENINSAMEDEKKKLVKNTAEITAKYKEKEGRFQAEYKKQKEDLELKAVSLEQRIKESNKVLEEERKMWNMEKSKLKTEIEQKENKEWQEKLHTKEKEMDALKREIEQKENEMNKYSQEDRDADILKMQRLKWEKDELADEKNKWRGKDAAMSKQLRIWKYTALACLFAILAILIKWVLKI